tara:strand:+ start:93 stop:239 length:147 start_codon:yes stop_codon:yes gene_type:complete
MKCIKKAKTILRVSDKEAAEKVATQGYEYCPKHEWKAMRPKPPKSDDR